VSGGWGGLRVSFRSVERGSGCVRQRTLSTNVRQAVSQRRHAAKQHDVTFVLTWGIDKVLGGLSPRRKMPVHRALVPSNGSFVALDCDHALARDL